MISATPAGCDTLERLVELRLLHQTQRAANSVRSRGEPKTQKSQDGQPTETSAAAKRQKLCAQMADVIRRSGTGLERCARWRSAPGTMDPSEVSELNGNSANAEVVAKDRVRAVSDSTFQRTACSFYNASPVQALELRRKTFTLRVDYARHLADGLVGSGTDRPLLKSGSWAFVFSDNIVYVGEGTGLYLGAADESLTHSLQFWLSIPRKLVQGVSTHGNSQQAQLVPFRIWLYKRMRPWLLVAPTNSGHCSIRKSLPEQKGRFSISQRPNFFVNFSIHRSRQHLGNLLYPTRIGWFSRRWPVHQRFVTT